MIELLVAIFAVTIMFAGYQTFRVLLPILGIILSYVFIFSLSKNVVTLLPLNILFTLVFGTIVASFVGTFSFLTFCVSFYTVVTLLFGRVIYTLFLVRIGLPHWFAVASSIAVIMLATYLFLFSHFFRYLTTAILSLFGATIALVMYNNRRGISTYDTLLSFYNRPFENIRILLIVALVGLVVQIYHFNKKKLPDHSKHLWTLNDIRI